MKILTLPLCSEQIFDFSASPRGLYVTDKPDGLLPEGGGASIAGAPNERLGGSGVLTRTAPAIVDFSHQQIEPARSRPKPEKLVSGNPERTDWEHYSHNGLSCGMWSSEVGSWRVQFPENLEECFYIISGRIRLHDEAARIVEFGPGDAAVIPAGFCGIFEVVEPVCKHYVVREF